MNKNETAMRGGDHLSADMLAAMAETGRAAADARSLEHLTHCRSCMAAYADAVRYRTAWLGSPELFDEDTGEAPPSTPSPRRWIIPLAAGLLIVSGIGGWLALRPTPPTRLPNSTIAALLERASAGDLVFPGGEHGAAEPQNPYRGDSREGRAVEAAIEELRLRYENDSHSTDDLYALAAALMAAGRTDLAHDYVREGRARAPGHTGFMLLAAAIERIDGNIPEAERLLHLARMRAPGDATLMLDHAIVLLEMGSTQDATRLLEEVIRRAPGSALAVRAERLRRSLAPR